MAKHFSHQMPKTFHICKWISFAISTFVIVEEMLSCCCRRSKAEVINSSILTYCCWKSRWFSIWREWAFRKNLNPLWIASNKICTSSFWNIIYIPYAPMAFTFYGPKGSLLSMMLLIKMKSRNPYCLIFPSLYQALTESLFSSLLQTLDSHTW